MGFPERKKHFYFWSYKTKSAMSLLIKPAIDLLALIKSWPN